MNYKQTINKITQYEIAIIDQNVSTSDSSKYISKLHSLREQLFYALIDQAHKKEELRKVLIDDALRFIVFEERLLTMDLPSSQFNLNLKDIEETYQNLQEIDNQDELLSAITKRLTNVITALRIKHEERINDIYSLIKNILEIKQKEI